ncbi:MAG: hypothetical protein ACO204_02345 [Schleiferiaceae bacterium]
MVRNFLFIGFAASAALASSQASSRAEVVVGSGALAGANGLTGPISVAGLGVLASANGLANSTRSTKADTLVFVWWNLQNLFDTVANSGPRDRDFLPDGPYRWDSKRYYAKLYAVGRGLAAAAGGRIPDAIGVCEVENADVLDDLERRWPPEWRLWRLHRDSPDERGIDVAVWYNPERLSVDSVAWIHPAQDYPTREAIWVRWITSTHDTLSWIWVHLPSQRAPAPSARAEAMRSIIEQAPKNLDGVIGDLNEGPNGPLGTYLRRLHMQHLPWPHYAGSFAYRGRLEALDGVWVREATNWRATTHVVPLGLSKSPRLGYQIRGCFEGLRYRGGASDHLPVSISVEVN